MPVIATAGHVDHGKSTLVEALTGRQPDRLAEERRRGLSIELGFAWTTLASGATVAFVDVPGHERFVPTMLAGAGPVPAVLFVVAADEGWMPQSSEHLDALTALDVRHGLLAITRADLADPAEATAVARAHLAGTPLRDVPAVPVSAVTGAGLPALRAALDDLVCALPQPDRGGGVRLWCDRAFTVHGAGTVVTGTLGTGRIRVDDELELFTPAGARRVGVRGLESHEQAAREVVGVSRVAVNLRGLALADVARGDVLVTPSAYRPTDLVDAHVEPAPPRVPAQLQLHVGSAAVAVAVRRLGPDALRLRLRRPLPLRIGDRAVLRDPGRHAVLGGLTVLDVAPPELRRRGAAQARAAQLATMDAAPTLAAELARRGAARAADLAAMGVPTAGAAGWLVDPALVTRLAEAVTSSSEAGLPAADAMRLLDVPDATALAATVDATDGLELHAGRVVAAGLPEALRRALEALRADLHRAPFRAPDAPRLAALGLGSRELAALVRAGELVRVGNGLVLLPGAVEQAVAVLATLPPEFTASAARQALRTSRKVTLAVLATLAAAGRAARTADGGHRLTDRA